MTDWRTDDTAEIVASYYDAWRDKGADLSEVPLADDFAIKGPVASFADAAGNAGWDAARLE